MTNKPVVLEQAEQKALVTRCKLILYCFYNKINRGDRLATESIYSEYVSPLL